MPAVALVAPSPEPPRPPWAVGRSLRLYEVPLAYREVLRPISWVEGEEPNDEIVVPEWSMRVCGLSRRGRSPLLRAWLDWCAAGGDGAPQRALLIQNLARLMPPQEALRAIRQMIQGET